MSAFDLFLESMNGKEVTVIGAGVSNTPLISLLLEAGADLTICDMKSQEELGEIYDGLACMGVRFCTGPGYLNELSGDVIFRTPGLLPSHPALVKAAAQGVKITSEMETFFEVCPCKILAITGSDGKTTTTTLVSEILKKAGKTVHLGGNIGHPLLADVPSIDPGDYAVVELSSFQLMDMLRSPCRALVTNVTPNHLDKHKDMAEYVQAKTNLFRHQKSGDMLVLNADDPVSNGQPCRLGDSMWQPEGAFQPAPGVEVLQFSMEHPVDYGVYLEDGTIWYAENSSRRRIMDVTDIKIPGAHNVANYMAAACMTHGLVSFDQVIEVARTFSGVEHRLELVRTLDGVRYYNDSIASSPTRTAAGLRSFDQKVILLAGGHDKKIPYDEFGPVVCDHVKRLILIDANPEDTTAPAIRASVEAAPNYRPEELPIDTCTSFEEAVQRAAAVAQEGDIVLLSPASASFDLFKNFMQRGDLFKSLVSRL